MEMLTEGPKYFAISLPSAKAKPEEISLITGSVWPYSRDIPENKKKTAIKVPLLNISYVAKQQNNIYITSHRFCIKNPAISISIFANPLTNGKKALSLFNIKTINVAKGKKARQVYPYSFGFFGQYSRIPKKQITFKLVAILNKPNTDMNMKKPLPLFLFSSLLLLCLGANSIAQEVNIIPQAGFNLSTYNFNKTLNNTSQQRLAPGFTAGVGFNIAFDASRNFILQPEINYSMRNSITDFIGSGESSSPSASIRQKTQMHYVEVPLLARFDFGVGTRYYLNVGPSISYALAGRESYESATMANFDDFSRTADFDERFNRVDWGLWLGGGVEIPINDTFILLDGRYGIGFNKLYKNLSIPNADGEPTMIGADGRNRIFNISIGYALPL